MSGSAGVGSRFVVPNQFVVDPSGIPIVGAQLFFYATGTATFQQTFNDVALTIPNSNPVIADSAGRFGNVFMVPSPAYRVVLQDALGGIIWDMDPCGPAAGTIPGSVPVGAVIPYAGLSAIPGWLVCDGHAVSRTVFSSLFAVIGTIYGTGDGATTFNLPDLRGRVVAGYDAMGGVAANRLTAGGSGVDGSTVGATGGDELTQNHTHTLTDPQHSHLTDDPGHTHPQSIGQGTGGSADAWNITGYGAEQPMNISTQTNYAGTAVIDNYTGITIDSWGSGAGQNVQPTIVLRYLIYVG